jgi:ribosomal protein S18 acetylase RimI-like enzyme
MQGITIRALGPEDLAVLCAVPEGLFDEDIRPDQAEAFLADPANVIVLAFDGPLAVSMATGTILRHPDKPPSMFINEVGTRESHQRRGIARAVILRMLEIARARGCEGVWLGTEVDNAPAIGLYRSLEADEVQGIYFGWDDAL